MKTNGFTTTAIESSLAMKRRGLVLRSALVAALGGLLFGFDTAVISGTTDTLRQVFALSSQSLGFTVARSLSGFPTES